MSSLGSWVTGLFRLERCLSAFLVILAVAGCSARSAPVAPEGNTAASLPSPESASINVSIFVDGTASMQGYVSQSATESNYQELLRSVENALEELSEPSKKLYKFGTSVVPLDEGRRLNVTAGKDPAFYTGVGVFTQIETVLQGKYAPVKKNSLQVIVTDLFQKDTDITRLVGVLKTKYLSKGLVVGLVGVESYFNGEVYDLGTNQEHINLKARRPVYALVIGPYSDVAKYFDALRRGSEKLDKQGNFSIFTNRLLQTKLDFFTQEPLLIEEDGGGLISRGLLENSRTYWFEIQGEPRRTTFKGCSQLAFLPYVVPFDATENWQSTILQYQGEGKPKPVSVSGAVRVNVDPEACNEPAGHLGVAVTLSGASFDEPDSDYLVNLSSRPDLQKYPRWWDAWNTDDGVSQPSRTLHLRQFLRTLYRVALDSGDEVQMQFYVRR